MTPEPPKSTSLAERPGPAEWAAVLVILALLFLANLATINLYATVWTDDVLWSEPAINLARTGHFTTSVWQLQPAGTFWAAQSPLYPLTLSLWVRLWGSTYAAVRSFNILLVTVAALLTWMLSWRFRLVTRPHLRVALAALATLGYGVSFGFRCSRPDIAGMLSLVGLGLAFSVANDKRRLAWVFICAMIAPFVGVQVGLYAVVGSILAGMLVRSIRYREVIAVVLGVGAGALLVLALFAANGSLGYFLASISQATNEHIDLARQKTYLGSLGRRVNNTLLSYFGDFSNLPLIAGLVGFWLLRPSFQARNNSRAIVLLLALVIVMPIVFNIIGHFQIYYAYMVYVPLLLAFFASYDAAANAATPARRPVLRIAFVLTAVAAGLVGLPSRLMLSKALCQIGSRPAYAAFIQKHVKPDDIVYCDSNIFFETKHSIQRVFTPMFAKHTMKVSPKGHEFSPEEKQALTVMIVRPQDYPDLIQYFGGRWEAVSEPFGDTVAFDKIPDLPLLGTKLRRHLNQPQMTRYQVQIYRRVTERGTSRPAAHSNQPNRENLQSAARGDLHRSVAANRDSAEMRFEEPALWRVFAA